MATRPDADPGTKTEGGRHDAALSFPFGIGTKAANRAICSNVHLPYLLTPVSPFHAEPLHGGYRAAFCTNTGSTLPCLGGLSSQLKSGETL